LYSLLNYDVSELGAAIFGFEIEYGGGVFPRNVGTTPPGGTEKYNPEYHSVGLHRHEEDLR
jgi:hypothetical protein